MARLGYFPYTRTRTEAARGTPGQSKLNFLLQGLASPNLRGDYLGAFQAGLGGALAGRASSEQADAEAERQRLQDDLNERLFGLQERGTQADEIRAEADKARAAKEGTPQREYGALPWYMQEGVDPKIRAAMIRKETHISGGAEGGPKPVKDSVARRNKAIKEKRALGAATPDELQTIVDDETLEPETRAAAHQMIRKMEATSPSQIDQGALPTYMAPSIDQRVEEFRKGGYKR